MHSTYDKTKRFILDISASNCSKPKTNKRSLKTAREKQLITYRGTTTGLTTDFSSEARGLRSWGKNVNQEFYS